MFRKHNRALRKGGVYIAVLATALVVSLLSMSALIGQRLQNRMISAQGDIRQAQLNANSAIELVLLTMKQDANWRTVYTNGNWFVGRATGSGTCTANVTDPVDGNLANDPDQPVTILGIGYSGEADQRVKVTVDPRKDPLSCLRSAVAVGDTITLSGDTLRASNALITANSVSLSASQVYGKVEALSTSGSTFNSTPTIVTSAKRPTMPDWTSVFNYYKNNGTQIDINSLPTQTPNLGRNVSIESGDNYWIGNAPGMAEADVDESNNQARSGTYSLRVQNRSAWYAGASQYIDGFVKPGQQYTVTGHVYFAGTSPKNFRFTMFTKGVSSSVQTDTGQDVSAPPGTWRLVTATLTAQSWSGNLDYAFIKIAGSDSNNMVEFFFDDLTIRETTTGRFIYRQVLSPSINPFGTTNTDGIYWIDCNNSKIVIERSRILGTLLLLNPGSGSCIADGPINWQPAVAGYPALLVDATTADNADFSFNATNRSLSEKENGVNYNPAGAAHDEFGQDSDTNDIYRSSIRGLVAVRDDLSYQNRALIRGQVLVGGELNTSSGELEVEYLPDSLLNPPPGFTAPYSYFRRAASVHKAVAP